MAGKFDHDSAVTISGGKARAQVSGDWALHHPVGGYVAAIALRAAGQANEGEQPVSATFDFVNPVAPGPVEITTRKLATSGRRNCTVVELHQNKVLVLLATVWSGEVGSSQLDHDHAPAPSVAPAEYYPTLADVANTDGFGALLPVFDQIEERPIDWNSPRNWRQRAPVQQAWFRYPEDAGGDPYFESAKALVPLSIMPAFAAMMPHPVWNAGSGAQAETVRLAVNFHEAPATEWLLVKGEAAKSQGGLSSGTANAWNAEGKLVASAFTQFAGA